MRKEYKRRGEDGECRVEDRRVKRKTAVSTEDGSSQQHLLQESTKGKTCDSSTGYEEIRRKIID